MGLNKWQCYHCGHVFTGESPPQICPSCEEEGFWLDWAEATTALAAPVKTFMRSQLNSIDANESVANAAKLMRDRKIGEVLIKSDEEVLGILTERDVLYKLVAEDLPATHVMCRKIMSSPVVSVESDVPLVKALQIMEEHDFRRLLVVENGRPVGLLTQDAVLEDVLARFRRAEQAVKS